ISGKKIGGTIPGRAQQCHPVRETKTFARLLGTFGLRTWSRQPVPTRVRDARSRVRVNRQAIFGDGRCSFNDKPAGRVVEAEKVQLSSRRRIENVWESHGRGRGKGGDAGRLHGNVEGVL